MLGTSTQSGHCPLASEGNPIMAKTNFTYSCGHVGVALGRNRNEADRKATWLEGRGQACPECLKEQELAQAKEARAANEWPPLEAVSQKQMDYAIVVRARQMAQIPELQVQIRKAIQALKLKIVMDGRIKPADVMHHLAALKDAMNGALHNVEEQTSAKWWLDVGPVGAVSEAWNERLKIMTDALEANGVLPAKDAQALAKSDFKTLAIL